MLKIDSDLVRRRAKELSTDEGFKQVLASVKETVIREWAGSTSIDQVRREELYRDLQGIGRLERHIQAIVDGDRLTARKDATKKQ